MVSLSMSMSTGSMPSVAILMPAVVWRSIGNLSRIEPNVESFVSSFSVGQISLAGFCLSTEVTFSWLVTG